MKKQFTYKLKDPISVASGGREIEGSKVVIKSPRPKDKIDGMALEALFLRCMMKAHSNNSAAKNKDTEENKEDKKDDNKGTEEENAKVFVSSLMMGATKEDISEVIFLIKDLVCEGNSENPQGTIEGEKFTKPMFDEISMVDVKAILGRYIYHFLSSTLD